MEVSFNLTKACKQLDYTNSVLVDETALINYLSPNASQVVAQQAVGQLKSKYPKRSRLTLAATTYMACLLAAGFWVSGLLGLTKLIGQGLRKLHANPAFLEPCTRLSWKTLLALLVSSGAGTVMTTLANRDGAIHDLCEQLETSHQLST